MTTTTPQEPYVPVPKGYIEPTRPSSTVDPLGLIYGKIPQTVLESDLGQKVLKNEYVKTGTRNFFQFLKENKFELSHALYNTCGMAYADWLVTGLQRYNILSKNVDFMHYQYFLNFFLRPLPFYTKTGYRVLMKLWKKEPLNLRLAEWLETHLTSMPWLDFIWFRLEGLDIPKEISTPYGRIPSELFILMFLIPGAAVFAREPIKRSVGKIITEGYDITNKRLTQFLKSRSGYDDPIPTSQFFEEHVRPLFSRD